MGSPVGLSLNPTSALSYLYDLGQTVNFLELVLSLVNWDRNCTYDKGFVVSLR